FFAGREETATELVRKHYRRSGFDPAALIEPGIKGRLHKHPGLAGQTRAPSRLRTLVLLLAGFALLALEVARSWDQGLVLRALQFVCVPFFYVPGLLAAVAWRKRTEHLNLASLTFLLPGLAIAGAGAFLACFDDWFRGVSFFIQSGPAGNLALAVFPLAAFSSLLNNACSRETPATIRKRQLLLLARRHLARELESRQPALRDEWFPYLLAFGLERDVDRWFHAFGTAAGGATGAAGGFAS